MLIATKKGYIAGSDTRKYHKPQLKKLPLFLVPHSTKRQSRNLAKNGTEEQMYFRLAVLKALRSRSDRHMLIGHIGATASSGVAHSTDELRWPTLHVSFAAKMPEYPCRTTTYYCQIVKCTTPPEHNYSVQAKPLVKAKCKMHMAETNLGMLREEESSGHNIQALLQV